jgi:hypothetical protein
MRITVFDDDGNELAQGSVRGMKLDSRKQSVEITAKVVTSWHPLNEGGGRSVSASIAKLMDYLAASGKTVVSYTSGTLTGPNVHTIDRMSN